MKRITVLFACLMLVMAGAVVAQDAFESVATPGGKAGEAPVGTDDCSGGIIHDDGVFENGYSGNAAVVFDFGIGDLFTEAAGASFGRVCVCFTSNAGLANVNFDLFIWDDDGPGGAPGTVLHSESVSAAGVPGFPGGAFYGYDLAAPVPSDGTNYVGVRYAPLGGNNLFVCADESVTTPLAGGWVEFAPAAPWEMLGAPTNFVGYRSMLIRAELGGGVPTVPTWGLILLGAALLVVSLVVVRRFA